MQTSPYRRVRNAPRSLTGDQLAADQLAELAQLRELIRSTTLSTIAKADKQISSALAHCQRELAENEQLVAEIDELRTGRPVIARDDYSGPPVEVYHYLDRVCDKRPVRGRIMWEPQAKALDLRPANCRCAHGPNVT